MSGLGGEAIVLAEAVGVDLSDWQRSLALDALATRADGSWVHTTVCDSESRQNGKGESIQCRELYGGLVLGERIIHTTHELATTNRAFERAEQALRGSEVWPRVDRVRYANGEREISFKSGGVILYRARTKKSGRGIDNISLVVIDEAQHLTVEEVAALSPTMATAEFSQRWFAGSPGLATSHVWWGLRRQGALGAPGLLWREATAETLTFEEIDGAKTPIWAPPEDPSDPELWARANPMLGDLISEEFLRDQLATMGPEVFMREHLGVWDPENGTAGARAKISLDDWTNTTVPGAGIASGLVLAFDMAADSSSAVIAAAGRDRSGSVFFELVEEAEGVGWLSGRLKVLIDKHRPELVTCWGAGPARVLVPSAESVVGKTKFRRLSSPDMAAACEGFAVGIAEGTLCHLGDPRLTNLASSATATKTNGGWIWSRRGADTAPLFAVSAAVHGASGLTPRQSAYAAEDAELMIV